MKKIIRLLNDISPNDLRKTYMKGTAIFLEGDIIRTLCIIESGSVRGEKNYPDGEMHIVEVFEPGDIFALEITVSRTKTSTMDYISNDKTIVRFISLDLVEKSAHAREIKQEIAFELADENIRRSHKIEILAERGLRNRILTYLHVLQRKSGSRQVTIKMNREQLAKYLCVNRSALSSELNLMKKEGIIDFKGSKFTLLK